MSEEKSYYSANEKKLDSIADDVFVKIPTSKYEEVCPKCKKIASPESDWVGPEQAAAGARGAAYIYYGAFPRHCSNGHWWIPCSPKVYTEAQMKKIMLEKKEAGNPCGKINVGLHDFTLGRWVTTDVDRKYFEENGWKAVSLTREEYFGAEVYNKALVKAALKELETTRKKARQLAAYAKKVAANLKNRPKGGRGKKKKANTDD